MKNITKFATVLVLIICPFSYADTSVDTFIGKKWSELPKSKYGGFTLPLAWKGNRKLSLRYYELEFGKEVITIVENKDPKDPSQDLILAVLDLRQLTSNNEKTAVVGTNDCELKGNAEKESIVIGVIKQDRDKPVGKYKPSRAWLLDNSTMKFKEVPAVKVTCQPQNYEG